MSKTKSKKNQKNKSASKRSAEFKISLKPFKLAFSSIIIAAFLFINTANVIGIFKDRLFLVSNMLIIFNLFFIFLLPLLIFEVFFSYIVKYTDLTDRIYKSLLFGLCLLIGVLIFDSLLTNLYGHRFGIYNNLFQYLAVRLLLDSLATFGFLYLINFLQPNSKH